MKAWFQFRLYERRFRESSPDGLSIRLGSMQMRNLRLHLLEQARQNQLRYAAMSLRIGIDAVRQEPFVSGDVDPIGVDIDQISVGFESNAADGSRVAVQRGVYVVFLVISLRCIRVLPSHRIRSQQQDLSTRVSHPSNDLTHLVGKNV